MRKALDIVHYWYPGIVSGGLPTAAAYWQGGPMLVLTRKRREQIVIGSEIMVTVLEVKGNRVTLGFKAPLEVRIFREELCRNGEVTSPEADSAHRSDGRL